MIAMSAQKLLHFLNSHFPHTSALGFQIDALSPRKLSLRLPYHVDHLRPGGTISGPAMMMLADTTMWLMLIAENGPDLRSATSNLNMNFLVRPDPVDIVAKGEILRMGPRLAVGDVRIYADDRPEIVAQASVTYAISASA